MSRSKDHRGFILLFLVMLAFWKGGDGATNSTIGQADKGAASLKILSVSPGTESPLDIGQTTPITVVFNKAVIPLGADFGDASLPPDLVPFSLTGTIPGRLRWVTTYIARFDPIGQWPTDLNFTLVWNDNLTSYDGSKMEKTVEDINFKTPGLSLSMQTVTSELASNLTGGMWSPQISSSSQVLEFPPDGKLQLQFSGDGAVDINLVKTAIQITPAAGGASLAVPLSVEACVAGAPFDMRALTVPLVENRTSCIVVSIIAATVDTLAVDQLYTISLPAGSRYHPLAGPLQVPIYVNISGLRSFRFLPFGDEGVLTYRRLDMFLRHGLQNDSATLSALTSAFSLHDESSNKSVPFQLNLPSIAILRISAQFLSNRNYSITVNGTNEVRDGFNLPLESSILRFGMGAIDSFFSDTTDPVFFENGSSWNGIWPIYAQNASEVLKLRTVASKMQAWSLRSQADVLTAASSQDASEFLKRPPGVVLTAPANQSMVVLNGDMKPLLSSPGSFVHSTCCVEGEKQVLSLAGVTSIGATFISGKNDTLVWVTSLSDASAIVGAVVQIYLQEPEASAALWAQATTGDDGTALLTSGNSSVGSNAGSGFMLVTYQGAVLYIPGVVIPALYEEETKPVYKSTLVSDRALYNQGDIVSLKGFIRVYNGAELEIPGNASFTLRVSWTQNTDNATTIPVTFNRTFGTFVSFVRIPLDAYLGEINIGLNQAEDWLASLTIVVGDPRPPTVTLSFVADSTIIRKGGGLPATITMTSYLGDPVAGAVVDLSWDIGYIVADSIFSDAPLQSAVAPFVTVPLNSLTGNASVTTDSNGTAFVFLQPAQSLLSEGTSVSVTAAAIGPSGERLTESITAMASESEFYIIASLTSEPLPGFDFGVAVNVQYRMPGAVLSPPVITVPVSVSLLRNETNGTIAGVSTCSSISDGGIAPNCRFVLPDVGHYIIQACVNDSAGYQACMNVTIGKTAEEWQHCPLQAVPRLLLSASKSTYSLNETPVLYFDNLFENAKLLARWGNPFAQKKMIMPLQKGPQAINFTVGEECIGSCGISLAIVVPRQNKSFIETPGVVTGHLFDPTAPRTIFLDTRISVNMSDALAMDVEIGLNSTIVAPGSEVTLELTVGGHTDAVSDSELLVLAVDKSILDLKPSPLVDLVEKFSPVFSLYMYTLDSRDTLVVGDALEKLSKAFIRLAAQDPWLSYSSFRELRGNDFNQLGQVCAKSVLDSSDDEFLDLFTSCLIGSANGCGTVSLASPLSSARGRVSSANEVVMSDSLPAPASSSPPGAQMRMRVSSSTSVRSSSSSPPPLRIRTLFQTTPLFAGQIVTDASGKAQVKFKLPDNVGTFTLRAYAVSRSGRFGQVEKDLIVRKTINVVPAIPRVVRIGDTFMAGVVVTLFEPVNENGTLLEVSSQVTGAVQLNDSLPIKSVAVSGSGPHKVKFLMVAASLGTANLTFTATAANSSDGVQVPLEVVPVQEPVFLAASIGIKASPSSGRTLWNESVSLPDAAPGSGSIEVIAGVGRLPAIRTLSSSILKKPSSAIPADWLVSSLVPEAVLKQYNQSSTDPLLALAVNTSKQSESLLPSYTKDCCGLVSFVDSYAAHTYQTDLYLNAFALTITQHLQKFGESLSNGTQSLVRKWRSALVAKLVIDAREALGSADSSVRASFYEAAAFSRLVLGANWTPPTSNSSVNALLSLGSLDAQVGNLSICGRAALALTHLNSAGKSRNRSQEVADKVVADIFSLIRVTGRTAYISAAVGSPSPASRRDHSLCLMVLIKVNSTNLLVEKIANYISSALGNANGLFSASVEESAYIIFALAAYDTWKNNIAPNLSLSVVAVPTTLLNATFTSSENKPAMSTTPWDELPSSNSSIQFFVEGSGEVSVALGLTFVPRMALPFAVFRGIYVERLIQRVNSSSGEPFGTSLTAIEADGVVAVTLQISSPDDVSNLEVLDLVPGGLEPLDPNIYGDDSSSSSSRCGVFGISSFLFPYLFCPSVQVSPDRVHLTYSYFPSGTRSFTYIATAVTPGIFSLPPVKAYVRSQPEVMGLSKGGQEFIITDETISAPPTMGNTTTSSSMLKSCPAGCSGHGTCNAETGECICDQGYTSLDCSESTA